MKKSILLLLSWMLTIGYLIVLFINFTNIGKGTETSALAQGVVFVIMIPHLIVVLLALIFNILGWALKSRGFALTCAILYTVGMVFFPPFFYFLIIQMILSYVGFALTKKPILLVQTV